MTASVVRQSPASLRPVSERRAVVESLKGRSVAELAAICDRVLAAHVAGERSPLPLPAEHRKAAA